jgi:hypothetical protein
MMRTTAMLGLMLLVVAPAVGQNREPPPPPRYGVDADLDAFPQDTPKAALASVVKAIDSRRYSYLAAQLADPEATDKRVAAFGGKFDAYVRQITERLTADPEAVRQLRRFAVEGEFNVTGDAAVVSHKEIQGRQVFLRRVGSRWYLEDRQKARVATP